MNSKARRNQQVSVHIIGAGKERLQPSKVQSHCRSFCGTWPVHASGFVKPFSRGGVTPNKKWHSKAPPMLRQASFRVVSHSALCLSDSAFSRRDWNGCSGCTTLHVNFRNITGGVTTCFAVGCRRRTVGPLKVSVQVFETECLRYKRQHGARHETRSDAYQ